MDIIFYFIEKIYEALSYMALMQHLWKHTPKHNQVETGLEPWNFLLLCQNPGGIPTNQSTDEIFSK